MSPHPIPDAALDADIATLAQKGAGKTYLNKGLVERLLDLNRRVVVMDPLNIWWGLKALADGSPGYPVVVVGGPNADVPLDPKKGVDLAAYVAKSDVRMVVDVSELRTGELVGFATAFLAELYRLNRDPLWLVLEEADVFVPQNPQGNESFMLHEVDMIARRGRQRGFRLWTICQRPQEVNKKALSQTATMILMRLMSPQDRKAAEGWLLAHGTKAEAAEILGKLPSLNVGEGYLLSPQLGILQRAAFPPIRTLDNSATPKAGEKRVGVKALAKVDVGALRDALKSEPAARSGESAQEPTISADEIKGAEERGFKAGLIEGEKRGFIQGQAQMFARVHETLMALQVEDRPSIAAMLISEPSRAKPQILQPDPEKSAADGFVSTSADQALTGPQLHLLSALAWWNAMGHGRPTRLQVAAVAGWAATSGHLKNVAGSLRTKGLIDYPENGLLAMTPAGADAAPKPDLTISMLERLRSTLTNPQREVLDVLLRAEADELSREQVALRCGWEPTSGHVKNVLGSMKTLQVIEYPSKGVVALQYWVRAAPR